MTLWIQTARGIAFNLREPTAAMVDGWDIAIALSRIVRFNGHTTTPCTVAEHSVRVMHTTMRTVGQWLKGRQRERLAMAALLHDAHEAYMGDIATPVAMALGDPASGQIQAMKARIQIAIHERFDVPVVLPIEWQHIIVQADDIALATEKRDVMGPEPMPWHLKAEPENDVIAAARHVSTVDFLRTLYALAYPGEDVAIREIPDMSPPVGWSRLENVR